MHRLIYAFIAIAAALVVDGAWAQTASSSKPSVETYIDQAVPTSKEGLLPEGVEWNKPLKAGTIVLPRVPKAKSNDQKQPEPPKLPVGALDAPQLKPLAKPPQLKSNTASSANIMLMQGMKKALQQAGNHLSIPVSEKEESKDQVSDKEIPEEITFKPLDTTAGKDEKANKADKENPKVVYEPGREPRNLASGHIDKINKEAEKDAAKSESIALTEQQSALPTLSEANASVAIPKATDLAKPPVPLEQIPGKTFAMELPKEKPSSTSIFGPSVEEKGEEKNEQVPKIAPGLEEKTASKVCEPKVTPWTRECGEAGYPAHYTGKITGETRVECPGGEIRDVWTSNTCAPPSTTKPKLVKEPGQDEGGAVIAARVDANCGPANGLAVSSKPVAASDLCLSGTPSEVTGEGPWRWDCKGSNGGISVSCAAPLSETSTKKAADEKSSITASKVSSSPEDGKCGAADGVGVESAPDHDLCAKGIASRVNGGGPWTWACSGTNGGQAAACSAPRMIHGTCGAAGSAGADRMPDRDLCATGYASAVTGNGPWHWTCSGLYGGAAATCSAAPKVNAVCGPASVTGHDEAPKEGLCKYGTASKVEGDGPWTWTCVGEEGGASVQCKAPKKTDGICGAAHGGSFEKAPKEDLCAQGRASRVTGHGPWSWSCSGSEGGNAASCTALPVVSENGKPGAPAECGAAAEMVAFQAPTKNLCAGGRPSAVSGTGPWMWTCSDNDGKTVTCKTLEMEEGTCGEAANVPSAEAPIRNLCSSGTQGKVMLDKSGKNWTWDCFGSKGSVKVSCSAPAIRQPGQTTADHAVDEVKCGAASGRGTTEAPTSELCDAGKPTPVTGKGPWNWSCKSGKRSVSCEAPRIVDGVCGPANGSIQKSLPLTGLCAAGKPTEVDGVGPWLWSCIGEGGGVSVSCSAASQAMARVDGSCGAAANAVMTQAPDTNLCDSGVPSQVHGEGPWTWTCSGLNGGIAATCTTSKVIPKAPPPPSYPVNGMCGPANGVAAVVRPMEGLCSAGTVTDVSGNGPWNWSCIGSNGGMTVSCTAPLMPPAPIDGMCGPANGVATLTAPKSGLCSAGIASAVSGNGPWTWSCSGANGGGAVACVAPVAGKSVPARPLPSTVTPSSGEAGEAPAPSAAPVGLVTPRLPAGALPPLKTGTMPSVKSPKPAGAKSAPATSSSIKSREVSPSLETAPQPSSVAKPSIPLSDDSAAKKVSPALKSPSLDSESKSSHDVRVILDPEISSLSFDQGSDAIDKDTAAALDKLAGILLQHGEMRITLNAYASTGIERPPREARRLSLARALAVRDYLTKKGVSSNRINVRALGANVPSGDMDRVDVKIN